MLSFAGCSLLLLLHSYSIKDMFVMYQDCVSPHQLPLARELVLRLGTKRFRYVYRDLQQEARVKLGWTMNEEDSWLVHFGSAPKEVRSLVEDAEVLLTMFRDPDLISYRCAQGLKTFYDSERWLKPVSVGVGTKFRGRLPGWVKLLVPSYFRLAMKMAKLLLSEPNFYYLPIGPHAARDMRFICRLHMLLHPVTTPKRPLSEKFIPWGYFVAPSTNGIEPHTTNRDSLRVLYVGRLLKLKHVDTIIRAIAFLNSRRSNSTVSLTIVGDGPEKSNLQKLAFALKLSTSVVCFTPSVPISEVRTILRRHDVLAFASDASDGWGAVVSEALSEGVPVIGTFETGASAALLPENQLFHSGNYRELARKLAAFKISTSTLPCAYTPSGAAERILSK